MPAYFQSLMLIVSKKLLFNKSLNFLEGNFFHCILKLQHIKGSEGFEGRILSTAFEQKNSKGDNAFLSRLRSDA